MKEQLNESIDNLQKERKEFKETLNDYHDRI